MRRELRPTAEGGGIRSVLPLPDLERLSCPAASTSKPRQDSGFFSAHLGKFTGIRLSTAFEKTSQKSFESVLPYRCVPYSSGGLLARLSLRTRKERGTPG